MSFKFLLFELDDKGVAQVVLNRPDKLNALNFEMLGELETAFEQTSADPQVRAILLSGAGGRAFAAGADIAELARLMPLEAEQRSRLGQRVCNTLEGCGKPSAAAIEGHALGGGLELAMACTFRVAGAGATLGQPEVKLGLIAGFGGTQRLPRLAGRGAALEMLLTGEPVSAVRAHEIGLVNRVVEKGQAVTAARELLHSTLRNSSLALRMTLDSVDTGLTGGLHAGLPYESAAFGVLAASEDRKEGVAAFLEKRVPAFHGR